MRFQRYGKTYQLRVRTAEDLKHVLSLDESLWVATSAPTNVFRCDPALPALLDRDGNGRINTDDVKAAVDWLLQTLADPGGLDKNSETLSLAAIDRQAPDGPALVDAAEYVLRTLGRTPATEITLSDVRSFIGDLKKQPLNGDGVIVPEAADSPETAAFIKDVMATVGTEQDASERPGITAKQLDDFLAAVNGYLEWKHEAGDPVPGEPSPLMPLGTDTPAAYDIYRLHAAKIDLFFATCRALGFEPGTAAVKGVSEPETQGVDFNSTGDVDAYLERAHLARPSPKGELPLRPDSVNPLYRDWLLKLCTDVLSRVLDCAPDALAETDWQRVKALLQPYEAYLAGKKGACVEKLPMDKLKAYSNGSLDHRARELIEQDKKVATIVESVRELEKLLLYHQLLLRFVNNFVSFSQLYSLRERALFEMGSAVIDGRWFDLALEVKDTAAHSAIAKTSNIFTIYLEVTAKADADKFVAAVPATSGSKGNLVVGKRGVFFSTDGREYDARITRIIQNPISLREALVAPFVRLWDFVLGKIEAMSGSSEKKLQQSTDAMMKTTPPAGQQAPSLASRIPGGPAGLVVGLSVSVAAIGSAFAFITKTLTAMSGTQVLLGVAGAALVVLVPVFLTATLRLRRQDLSSLLEGSGWAVNARMRLSRAQKRQFTRRAPFPEDAVGTPRHHWLKIAVGVIVLLLAVYGVFRLVKTRTRNSEDPPREPAPRAVEAVTNAAAETQSGN